MTRIVDSHAHIMLRPYGTLKPAEPEVVVEHFARRGVDQAWYSSVDALAGNQTNLHRRCNDHMAELQQQFGDAFVALATVNPRDGDEAARELERAVTQLGLKGWKFHGWLQPVSCCDPCIEPVFDAANELRLVVLFHDGTPPFTSSLQIGHLAEQYPHCSMILGHGGLKDLANAARVIGVTRARVTQIMNLLLLAPEIQEAILDLPLVTTGRDPVSERALRRIVAEPDWQAQLRLWNEVKPTTMQYISPMKAAMLGE